MRYHNYDTVSYRNSVLLCRKRSPIGGDVRWKDQSGFGGEGVTEISGTGLTGLEAYVAKD